MEEFLVLKECLIQFQYPNIGILCDLEITKLFAASNRTFLLGWILKKINKDFEFEGVNQQVCKTTLANLICAHGFCMSNEKDEFVNGELNAPASISILHRMVVFMRDVNKKVEGDDSVLTSDDLLSLNERDLNLFPENGPLQNISDEGKLKKIEELEAELQLLKEQALYRQPIEEDKEYISKNSLKDLDALIQDSKRLIPQVNIQYLNMFKNNKPMDRDVKFTTQHLETVKKLNENLDKFVEFQQNMKTIDNFKAADYNANEVVNEDICQMLQLVNHKNIDVADLPNLL